MYKNTSLTADEEEKPPLKKIHSSNQSNKKTVFLNFYYFQS